MDELVIWAAGFFDGEGCVGLYTHPKGNPASPQVLLRVQVVNTDIRPLDELKARFGGSRVVSWNSGKPNCKTVYRLDLTGQRGYEFLTAVLPYLRCKKAQAELALKFWELPWRNAIRGQRRGYPRGVAASRSAEEVTTELDIARQIKALKRA